MPSRPTFFWRILVTLLGAVILGSWTPVAQAQISGFEGPVEHSDDMVSAIVPVRDPPPVPILRRPRHNSYLNSGKVEFRWKEVTGHLVPLDRYEFSLNGERLYVLDLTDEETDEYSYYLEDGEYHLVLKSPARLENGSYTWKIRVLDINDNGSDSATWQFTVDSTPPPIIVTEISGEPHSISASDPDTIPVDPVIVTVSDPYIYGSTESLAEVQLIVYRADGSVHEAKMTATSDGHFLFYLPFLNPDEIVSLSITAIDLAGNTRSLTGLRLQYVPRKFVLPIPDFYPGQPDVVIPIPTVPGIIRPRPTPPPLDSGDPARPTPAAPQTYERPVHRQSLWRMTLLFLILGYVLLLFIWTGNPWYFGLTWLWHVIPWWILWREGHDRVTTPRGSSVPWLSVQGEWIEAGGKLKRFHSMSSPGGFWVFPNTFPSLAKLMIDHQHWSFTPVDKDARVPKGYIGVDDLTFVRPETHTTHTATEIPPDKLLWVWVSATRRCVWRWRGRWIPRLWIILTLLVALWVTYQIPVIEMFIWLAVVGWLVGRDVQGRLSERWAVWGETV